MNLRIYLLILQFVGLQQLFAQPTAFSLAKATHPRLMINVDAWTQINKLVNTDESARSVLNMAKQNLASYVDRHQTDSVWIVSRLQMYWKTKSTEVFIKGGIYDHAEGKAPVPTVRFPGARDNVTVYAAPKLEDIQPFMDDPRGVYLINRSREGQPMEWAEISKTGRIIESINSQIMGLAYNAAVIYWITKEEKYAKFAFDLFDTYMTGMNYRKEPTDLTHGHHQTLAGLSTFEVIQEGTMLNNLTGIYDYLYDYLAARGQAKMELYTNVFKKWADLQITHGVAFNNWDLMEARNTLNIALMLEDDKAYADKKGNQYYTNQIVNITSERQWSLKKLVDVGYDSTTGLWYECPGYSAGVLNDFAGFVSFFDRYYKYDLLEQMPVLKRSVLGIAQYLFPNGNMASFGDSHYGRMNTNAASQLVANAQQNKKRGQEEAFTKYIKTIQEFYSQSDNASMERGEGSGGTRNAGLNGLLYRERTVSLDDKIIAGKISDYVTPVLSSPNVSYFALRNGFDKKNGMMVAMSGSKGNHMHAGGISMEIYGKGYVLGPESGIGTSYFQPDYAEYYSQFPAHNTVAVDGISAYPVMKSNHGFEVLSNYPASGTVTGFFGRVSFGNLYFLEPETNADQTRLTSIIRTSDSTAYYIDIFRSRRRDGKDKMHDYFYHNMGQDLVLEASDKSLDLQPTDKLSFSGGHLFAYDYIYDKRSVVTSKNINAVFKLSIPGREEVQMNMWMKGESGREIFVAKSPKSTAIDRMGLPKAVADLPLPTIIARQTGEAWTKPFAVVFEPSSASAPKSVIAITSFKPSSAADDFTGLVIENTDSSNQIIFSSAMEKSEVVYNSKSFTGTYAVISEIKSDLQYLFLGSGKSIASGGYSLSAKSGTASAALENKNGEWFIMCNSALILSIPANKTDGKLGMRVSDGNKITTYMGKRTKGGAVINFELPALPYSKIQF